MKKNLLKNYFQELIWFAKPIIYPTKFGFGKLYFVKVG